MERTKIRRKGNRILIQRKLDKTEHINAIELDILQKNEIPTLVPLSNKQLKAKRRLSVVLPQCLNLDEQLSRTIDFGQFCTLVQDVIKTVQNCNAHGIRSGNLELAPELIFVTDSRQPLRFLFWPVVTLREAPDICSAFLEYGKRYCPKAEEKTFKQRYLALLESRSRFSIFQFERNLSELYEQWMKETQKIEAPKGRKHVYLSRRDQMLQIEHFPFLVGRSPQLCDYACPNDALMSKRHFALDFVDGAVVLRDEGSRNGLIVNEAYQIVGSSANTIPGLSRVEGDLVLMAGDTIRAGGTSFLLTITD